MIRKSITTGVIIGLLLTLTTLYPAFAIFVSRTLRGSIRLLDSPLGEIRLLDSI